MKHTRGPTRAHTLHVIHPTQS